MRIGGKEMPKGAGLAPMAGVSDLSFRLLCHQFGAAYSVTEMVSAKGFLYAPKENRMVQELIQTLPQEGLVGLQLFGSDPELMAEAANQLQSDRFAFIDVNMGCPAGKIVKGGDGSALMKNPELAAAIIGAMCKRVKLPVTVKIRAGWDEQQINAVEMATALEQSGAQAITVHPRTRNQMYSGQADWSIIARIKERVQIPVIGNGDVRSGADALRMMKETGCDGVMIGRGAQGNPWIFAQVLSALNGKEEQMPNAGQRIHTALRHTDMLCVLKPQKIAICEMRKHMAWYLQGLRGAGQMRQRLNAMGTLEQVRAALLEYLKVLETHVG